jgi:hypothetical protein
MAASLGTLRTKVLGWLDETDNTTETFDNITNAINMSHRQRCTEQQWSFMLWRQPETFTLVSGRRRYALHPQAHRMLYLYNKTTEKYLIETPWRQVQVTGVEWHHDTTGERYVFVEPSPLAQQCTTKATISITSSSAGDTGAAKAVNITGMVDGVIVTEAVTPTGLTAAVTTNIWDAGSIIACTKIADWTGTLTVKQAVDQEPTVTGALANGTTLLTLRPTEASRSYLQIELLWTPSAADVIEYRFYRKPRTLSAISDIPDLPDEFTDLLVWDTLIQMAAYDGDTTTGRLAAWVEQRDQAVLALGQTFLDGSTVASEPRAIRDLSDDDGWN